MSDDFVRTINVSDSQITEDEVEQDETSVDDKIKNRLAYKKEKEGRAAKRTKLANGNTSQDDNPVDIDEEEEEEVSNDNEEQSEEENEAQEDELEAEVEEEDEEEEEEEEQEEEVKKIKSKTNEKDELRDLKRNNKKQETSGYFEAAPSLSSSVSFEDLELAKPLLKAVTALGYTSPTPIQAQAIPIAMGSKDIVGSAQTGSGKTAAFMLPILHKILLSDRRIPTIKCLVLAPTRELAVQCHSVSEKLARFTNLRCCLVIGGLSNAAQEAQLRTNPDIVVATPGRLIDHLRNAQSVSLEELEFLVIDEADRLLEVGFIEAVEEIIKHCPRNRQSLLFSATMTEAVDRLIKVSLNKPVRVSVDKTTDVANNLSQEFLKIKSEELREATLLAICSRTIKSNCIVFFAQKKEAHRAKLLFGLAGLNAAELHGNMTQRARLEALEKFRDGKTDFLLATDVAARGLDIMGIETVINFTMPTKLTTYIHRVGRTARAGEKGLSISLAGENDRALLKQIIKYAKSKVKQRIVPSEAITEAKEKIQSLQDDVKAIYKEENAERELRKTEMHATRIENILLHEDEIMSRPKKTWFVSSRDKLKIRENAKNVANEADYSDDDNEEGGHKNKKRKSREERDEIRKNQREREKKKIAKEMKSQTVSAKAFKREARNKKLGIASQESKRGNSKQRNGPKKSNFDSNAFQDNSNNFVKKSSFKKGKKY